MTPSDITAVFESRVGELILRQGPETPGFLTCHRSGAGVRLAAFPLAGVAQTARGARKRHGWHLRESSHTS